MPELIQTNSDVLDTLAKMNGPKGGGGGSLANTTNKSEDCSVLPEGSAERMACQEAQALKAKNKMEAEKAKTSVPQRPSPTPQPSATPPATPPSTPPATLAPVPPAPQTPNTPGINTAAANTPGAVTVHSNPAASGGSVTPANAGGSTGQVSTPPQSGAAATPAAHPTPTSSAAKPPAPAASSGLTVDQVNQLKKRYEDALQMPISADPQMAQQQRGYIESLKKELSRAMEGPMGHGMASGAVTLQKQQQARGAAMSESQGAERALRRSKADAEAAGVIEDAKEYLTEQNGKAPDETTLNTFLRSKGYRADGHKPNENRFDNQDKAKQYYEKHPGADKPVAPAAPPAAPANPNEKIDGTKSQLKQMFDAGFIDEAAFRRGMSDPYGHGNTIQAIYDQYVQKFKPQDPNQPFPENSA